MKNRLGLTTVMVVSAIFTVIAGCGGDGNGAQELVLELRADENAPEGFGTEPGEALTGAEVNVELSGQDKAEPDTFSGVTDDAGKLTLTVEDGSYEIFVSAQTTDPLCVWLGSSAATVSGDSAAITIDDMLVACE